MPSACNNASSDGWIQMGLNYMKEDHLSHAHFSRLSAHLPLWTQLLSKLYCMKVTRFLEPMTNLYERIQLCWFRGSLHCEFQKVWGSRARNHAQQRFFWSGWKFQSGCLKPDWNFHPGSKLCSYNHSFLKRGICSEIKTGLEFQEWNFSPVWNSPYNRTTKVVFTSCVD